MIIPSTEITIKGAKTEAVIAQACKDWAMACPHEVVALRRKVQDKRQHLHRDGRSGGLSTGGTMLHKAEIPVKLDWLLSKRLEKNWMLDPWTRNAVFRIFKMGLVNLTSESKR